MTVSLGRATRSIGIEETTATTTITATSVNRTTPWKSNNMNKKNRKIKEWLDKKRTTTAATERARVATSQTLASTSQS